MTPFPQRVGKTSGQKRGPNGRFLRRLRETPEGSCEWLIWSRYWRAWHRKSASGGANGYTDDIARAGLFPRSMASAYHDGDRDEAFHVSEKMAEISRALTMHDVAIDSLRALVAAADPTPSITPESKT